ncbi:MAG: hypothetical protein V1726_04810 [Methanobacteriota archaeon]
MNNQHKNRGKYAVSGVIEALLLIGLVAVVIGIIQVEYIPQVMNQREAEHMDQVSNQFSYLKSMIDIQTMTKSNAPIFSIITLGSPELPYFITAHAEGELNVPPTETGNITIGGLKVVSLTAIKYDAKNAYFIPQTYILESGGIILKQPDGNSTMRVPPSVNITEVDSEYNIYFDLVRFIGKPGKNVSANYGKCVIRTNFSHSTSVPLGPVGILRINTQYPHAWYEFLNDKMGQFVDVSLRPVSEPSYVEIKQKPLGNPIDNIYITEHWVEVQIGPGWVV